MKTIYIFASIIYMSFCLLNPTFSTAASAGTETSKNLIIYYSLSGNTKTVAETLHQLVGGEVLQIKTVKPYPADFHAVVEQARKERNSGYLPPIQPIPVDLEKYDTIYLGFPIWGNTIPQPMATFLSQNHLAGKTIIPFCTHDGYGVGRAFQVIGSYCPRAKILKGFDMLGSEARDARSRLAEWLSSLGVKTGGVAATSAETPLEITIGDKKLTGILKNGETAGEFKKLLPFTVSMGKFGNREYYGGIDAQIKTTENGQLRFDDGDITWCPQNNTVAIFYSQSDRPNLTMRVIPIGRITSNLAIFHDLPPDIKVNFAIK